VRCLSVLPPAKAAGTAGPATCTQGRVAAAYTIITADTPATAHHCHGHCRRRLCQVTINCAERGLLLLRVRDEIHMTMAAYQTLYESSIAFGMRKALVAEQRKAAMAARLRQLAEDRAELEGRVADMADK
jgi:Axonemal dynein light chain